MNENNQKNKEVSKTEDKILFNEEILQQSYLPFILNFEGIALIQKPKNTKEDYIDISQKLNEKSSEVSEEIRKEIYHHLPQGLDVQIQIEFMSESLKFSGVIQLIDFPKEIGFKELIISVAKLALRKIIRKEIEDVSNAIVKEIEAHVYKEDNINFYIRFLWWCSGASVEILRDMPTVKDKYASLGAMVLFTSVVSFLSSAYAFHIIFENSGIAFTCSLIWALCIFNLDRYLVSSLDKTGYSKQKISDFSKIMLQLFPRILLSIFIGVAIAKPLLLKVFESSIESELKTQYSKPIELINNDISRKKIEIANLNDKLLFESQELDKKLQSYLEEIEGSDGSKKSGLGSVAQFKQQLYQEGKEEFNELKKNIDSQNEKDKIELAELENKKENLTISEQLKPIDLVTRMKILSDLEKEDSSVAYMDFFITLLIILIQISPLISKMLSPKDIYEYKNELITRRIIRELMLPTKEIDMEVQKAFSKALDLSELNPKK